MKEKTLEELELEISSFYDKEEEIFERERHNPNSCFYEFIDDIYDVVKIDYKEAREAFSKLHSEASPYIIAINNALSEKENLYQNLFKELDFK